VVLEEELFLMAPPLDDKSNTKIFPSSFPHIAKQTKEENESKKKMIF